MNLLAALLVGFVAFEHLYFLVLEMFLWTKPTGRKVFQNTKEFAEASKVLAANQGLYNGFLAAGLVWGSISGDAAQALAVKTFFLGCVIVAGIFGAATVSKRILFLQAAPALLALILVRLAG